MINRPKTRMLLDSGDPDDEHLDLQRPWQSFDASHALTTQGIERFTHDYEQALAPAS